MKNKRPHPYMVLNCAYKASGVLLFPLIQLIFFNPQALVQVIFSAGYSIIWFLLFAYIVFLEYRSTEYNFNNDFLFINKGIVFKKKIKIPTSNIHSIAIKETVFSGLFKAVRFSLDTPANKNKSTDVRIFFSFKEAKNIINSIIKQGKKQQVYKASIGKILLMAIAWSNPVAILLIAVPFINHIGKILGTEISQRIYNSLNISLYIIALGIPPLIAGISYLMVALFLLAMFVHLFRYSNFKTVLFEDNIVIKRGLITKTKKIINREKINAFVIHQTLFMSFFKQYSLYASAIGLSKDKGDKSLILAPEKLKSLLIKIDHFIKLELLPKAEILSSKKAIKSFLFIPISLFLISSISLFFIEKNCWYQEILRLLLLFTIIFSVWWIFFRILAHKISGIYIFKKHITETSFDNKSKMIVKICGFKKFSTYVAYIPVEKIQLIKVKQNLFQKFSGLCNLKIYTYSEKGEYFSVKYINFKKLKTLLKTLKHCP